MFHVHQSPSLYGPDCTSVMCFLEGIMPFVIIVLSIPICMCHCSTIGSTTMGLKPTLKYLVL